MNTSNPTHSYSGERCTFAIISHPDAGKTTMTEKLLWFGRVIRQVGMVKSKQGQYTTSDWMEMEKKRGISVTTSVMSFEYGQRHLHLLDTPGHKDFSEDTYRTLTAVESVLMMIDSAKGVEAQTIKLMEVCRLRDTPIVTFMNKFDRSSMNPFDLLENVEKICSIQCCPMTWPIGNGVDFKGVIDLRTRKIMQFNTDDSNDPFAPKIIDAHNLDDPSLIEHLTSELVEQLKEDLEVIEGLLPEFKEDEFLAGIQTPVFFGTALHNFGVKEVLDFICSSAPGPRVKDAVLPPYRKDSPKREVLPTEKNFTGFIFKIQANMDKNHRDRMAFMRVCSGEFRRGDKLFHVRTGKEFKMTTAVLFQSRERQTLDVAKAGDVVGVHGQFQIGDTFSNGEKLKFTGIPHFAPEIFMRVLLKDPLKGKQLEKGLQQLSEEGAVQLFGRPRGSEKILGAVGALQLEVVRFRLEDEYKVRGEYESVGWSGVRWPKFKNDQVEKKFIDQYGQFIVYDNEKRICFAYSDAWDLKLAEEKFPDVSFYSNSEMRDGH